MVKVPCSDSNLSNRGVKAKIFITAWKKPAWTRGKVFVLYTGRRDLIRYSFSGKMNGIVATKNVLTGAQTNLIRDQCSPLLYVP